MADAALYLVEKVEAALISQPRPALARSNVMCRWPLTEVGPTRFLSWAALSIGYLGSLGTFSRVWVEVRPAPSLSGPTQAHLAISAGPRHFCVAGSR